MSYIIDQKTMENQPKNQGNFDIVVASSSRGIYISFIYLHNSYILQEKDSQEFPKKDGPQLAANTLYIKMDLN
jgi:hypothetical protein